MWNIVTQQNTLKAKLKLFTKSLQDKSSKENIFFLHKALKIANYYYVRHNFNMIRIENTTYFVYLFILITT